MLESKRYFTPPDCPVPYLVLNSLLPKWRGKGLRRKDGYLRLKCSIAVHLAKDWMQEEHFLRGLRLYTQPASLLKTGSRMTKEWKKEKLGEGTRVSRDVGALQHVKKEKQPDSCVNFHEVTGVKLRCLQLWELCEVT